LHKSARVSTARAGLKRRTLTDQSYVHIPETARREAQEFLRTLKDPHLIPAFSEPTDIATGKKLQAWAESDGKAKSEPLLKR
jgi:hypothetical protein